MSLLPSFPASPTNGQIAAVGDYTYTYTSSTDSWRGRLVSSSSLPAAAADLGTYMFVTRSDGSTFSYNTTTAGSNLRRIGVLTTGGTPTGFYTSLGASATINLGNLGSTNNYPLTSLNVVFSTQSLSGTWLALGSVSSVGLSSDGTNYSYINYQPISLAVRIL